MRLAWVCPISARTGVGSYAQTVLRALVQRPGLEVVVLHPPCPVEERLEMPCPTLPLSEGLIASDLPALFDLMLYHLGNNARHHGLILQALMAHPGPVVLHDHVYQHVLAGVHHDGEAPAPGFGALIHAVAGAPGFDYLAASGVLRASAGAVSYVPWDSAWAAQVPLSDVLARLATGVVTHSDFAGAALGKAYPGATTTLFMPRPEIPVAPPERTPTVNARLRLAATGHIGPTKGLELLLGALSSDPDLVARYHVTIAGHAGEATYMESLHTQIAAQGLTEAVRLVIDPDDAGFDAVMQEADLFLNLRRPNTEGASLSLAEQMASGRPVIVQASGAFAEMPASCGWHLPPDGGAAALADTLRAIARDPAAIATRGLEAARHMGSRSATAYAEGLASFLYAGQAKLARRAAAVRQRSPVPDPQDREWFHTYAQVRGLMAGYLDGRCLLPPDLWSYPAADVGTYVALNLLNSPVPSDMLTTLGRAVQEGGPLAATARIGALRQLVARADGAAGDVPHYLSDLYLPCPDPALWTVILCLPPGRALPLALQALGQRAAPDVQARLCDLAARTSVGAALIPYLQSQGDPVLEPPRMAAVKRLLEDPGGLVLRALPPLAPGADLVALAQDGAPLALRFDGFHPPETAGIWTAQPLATIRALPDPDHPVTALTGEAALLDAALAETAQEVTVRVLEEDSGRCESWAETRPAGSAPAFDWALSLPGFCGPLRVELSLPACHTPQVLGSSADPRPLGLMLRRLRLEAGPRRIAA